MTTPDAPSPTEVNKLHANSDADVSKVSQHHTLGTGANQASPGDHTHDGRNSKNLLAGTTLLPASNPPTQAEVQQCINALKQLGAS